MYAASVGIGGHVPEIQAIMVQYFPTVSHTVGITQAIGKQTVTVIFSHPASSL